MSTTPPRPTPETDSQCYDCEYRGHMGSVFTAEAGKSHPYGDHVSADFARKLERERDEAREQLQAMREAIKEGYDALTECVDDSGELLAEHGWWKDEPRCGYQVRYDEHKQRIEDAEAALTKLKLFIKP